MLVDGLRARGWDVSTVVAYRTVPVIPPRSSCGPRRTRMPSPSRPARPSTATSRAAGVGAVPSRRRRHRPGDVRGGGRPRPGGGRRGGPALARRPRRGHGGGAVVSAPRSVVEALVFDLDGTIADTESVEYDAIRRVWADHGIDYPIERWSQVVGQAWSPTWVTELADEAGADPGGVPRRQAPLPRRAPRRARAPPWRRRADRRGRRRRHPAGHRLQLRLGLGRGRAGAARPAVALRCRHDDRPGRAGQAPPGAVPGRLPAAGRATGAIGGVRGLGHRCRLGRRCRPLHRRLPGSAHRRPRRRSRRPRRDVTRRGHAGVARRGGGGPGRRAGRSAVPARS